MSHLQKPLQEKVEEIAKKYNVSISKVEEIEATIWESVRKNVSEGTGSDPSKYENILLKYLGTFHIQPRKMKKFLELYGNKYD